MHTDEKDLAALFLYRKLSKEPILEPVLMAGPEVGASDEHMKVRTFVACPLLLQLAFSFTRLPTGAETCMQPAAAQ